MATKYSTSWILQGVCATNGNIMTFWRTNFNMPVPCLFNGSSDCTSGFMAARYGDMGSTSQSLAGHYAGYETALSDALFVWCVANPETLNGTSCLTQKWYRNGTLIGNYYTLASISLNPPADSWQWQWYEMMANIGIAGWEISCTTCYCTVVQAATYSGGDTSIGANTVPIDFGNVPDVTQCSSSLRGSIWVDGANLHYINANCWEHVMCGVCEGSLGTPGAIYIETNAFACPNYLKWVGSDGSIYHAPWAICQFCSSFSNGAPANPAPGASYAGNIWVDGQFGDTHLAYIANDGNKYLAGAGHYPYQSPY